jgi:hypothetical protein
MYILGLGSGKDCTVASRLDVVIRQSPDRRLGSGNALS